MFSQQLELFKNPSFRAYFFACMLAMFGNGLTYIIMIWVLMQFKASVGSTAILMACFWLPNILFSPFFGVIADRTGRQKMLLLSNGSRAVILLLFAWFSQYYLSAFSVYCLAVLVGCVLSAYIPAAMTFIREIMPREQMMYANAMIDIAYEMGAVVGMGGAGLILAVSSIPFCFLLNGMCYLFATLLIYRIQYQRNEEVAENKESFFHQLKHGWDYLSQRASLMLIYVVQALIFVSYMTVPVLLGPFAKTILNADVAQFGILEAMLSGGIIVGGFAGPYFSNRFNIKPVILTFIAIGIVAFYLFSHSSSIKWAYLFHFMIGLSFAVWALLITLAQEMTALNFQGRVQSLFNSFSGLLIVSFYYLFARMENVPVMLLYRGELILMAAAGLIMCYLLFSKYAWKTIPAESN